MKKLHIIYVTVFWILTPCNNVIAYQRFGGSRCLHLHFTLKMEAARTSEALAYYHNTTKGKEK
jgi:hypothetical protein